MPVEVEAIARDCSGIASAILLTGSILYWGEEPATTVAFKKALLEGFGAHVIMKPSAEQFPESSQEKGSK